LQSILVWTYDSLGGPSSNTITITADDGEGGVSTTTFMLVWQEPSAYVTMDDDGRSVTTGTEVTFVGLPKNPSWDDLVSPSISWQVLLGEDVVGEYPGGVSLTLAPPEAGDYVVGRR